MMQTATSGSVKFWLEIINHILVLPKFIKS